MYYHAKSLVIIFLDSKIKVLKLYINIPCQNVIYSMSNLIHIVNWSSHTTIQLHIIVISYVIST